MNFAGAMDGVFVGDSVFFANMSGIADLLLLALIAYCISFIVLLILLGVILFVRVRKGLADRQARQEARDRAAAWRVE
jgi:uncharacterized membrane protein